MRTHTTHTCTHFYTTYTSRYFRSNTPLCNAAMRSAIAAGVISLLLKNIYIYIDCLGRNKKGKKRKKLFIVCFFICCYHTTSKQRQQQQQTNKQTNNKKQTNKIPGHFLFGGRSTSFTTARGLKKGRFQSRLFQRLETTYLTKKKGEECQAK